MVLHRKLDMKTCLAQDKILRAIAKYMKQVDKEKFDYAGIDYNSLTPEVIVSEFLRHIKSCQVPA